MIDKASKEYSIEPSKDEQLEKATLEELSELEDEEEEDILQSYRFNHIIIFQIQFHRIFQFCRQKRIEEMKEHALRSRYGSVMEIKAQDWKDEVTNAPTDVYVIVHLYKPGIPACQIVNILIVKLANKVQKVLVFSKSFSSPYSSKM